MTDDELQERLRALGTAPVEPGIRADHLQRIAGVTAVAEPRRRGFVWGGIAAAAIVGFLAGSTGLAMADSLPGRAQGVAHDVLRVVQVDVPDGKPANRGACVSRAAKIKDHDEKKAAMDACPKGGPPHGGSGDQGGGPPPSDDPCHGRPPWAGPMSKEDRQAAKELNSRASCPDDDADDDADDGDEADAGAPGGPPAADDPCHGRPPWAGPMSKEDRQAAKESASRADCPDDSGDERQSNRETSSIEDQAADDSAPSTTTESSTVSSTTSAPSP